jgi:hypothetical protein
MNDKEYVEFLEAVAAEYLRMGGPAPSRNYVDELAANAQLARIVGEKRRENELLRRALGSELKQINWEDVEYFLDETGVTEALDQNGEALLGDFRRSVVPEADLEILRQAGIVHPEAALRIAEEQARVFARRAEFRDFRASNVLRTAGNEIKKAGAELDPPEGKEPSKKPRKWFKGISRILAGSAGSLGNILFGVGIIPVAAPVSAAAVLGSCTGGFIFIYDGIEALRGTD